MARKRQIISSNIYGTSSTVRPEPPPPPVQLELTRARSITRNKIVSGALITVLALLLALAAVWVMENRRKENVPAVVLSGYEPKFVRLNDGTLGYTGWLPLEIPTNGIMSLSAVQVAGVFDGATGESFADSTAVSMSGQRPVMIRSRDDVSYDLINAARKFIEMGAFAESEEQLRRVLQRNPDDFDANSLLGSVLMSQKKNTEAIVLYEQLIRRDPYKEELHNNLAIAYLRQNDTERAEKHLAEAVRLNGSYDDARVNYGLLLQHQRRYERAVEVLSPVVDRNPGIVVAAKALGLCYLELGRPMEGRLVLEELNRRLPQDVDVAFGIARCHLVEEKSENAIAWIKLASEFATPEQMRRELMSPIYAGLYRDLNFQRMFSRYLNPEQSAPPKKN
ncbi:MAG: tetratricopeptide repeat protein [Kiritimatiellia bacterium]